MRPELERIAQSILAATSVGDAVELDAIGEAIGTASISPDEIDALFGVLEAAGRRIASPEGARGIARLARVLDAARALRAELGRAPRADEIARHAGLSAAEVQHALALARVMQR
jgi:hypothetical protein